MAFSVAAVERLFKVLGDESRLRILQALADGERSVSEILERTGLPQTLASFHLRILREAGVLATERRGPFIYYRLADPSLPNLLEACAKYAESLTNAKATPDFQWPPWTRMCRMMPNRRR
ncbi:MAG TPA: metalloregulator ArsR/SmtB family transcription factor [Candidatus Methylomirabilis sp.]|nr:metalloregulator ArsR/SmtB family transcription factor [Candidatus Methylomirabilis sp.]